MVSLSYNFVNILARQWNSFLNFYIFEENNCGRERRRNVARMSSLFFKKNIKHEHDLVNKFAIIK